MEAEEEPWTKHGGCEIPTASCGGSGCRSIEYGHMGASVYHSRVRNRHRRNKEEENQRSVVEHSADLGFQTDTADMS